AITEENVLGDLTREISSLEEPSPETVTTGEVAPEATAQTETFSAEEIVTSPEEREVEEKKEEGSEGMKEGTPSHG
ncbi:MAG: hypothetical protein Q8N70_01490, partial [Deltaproteobacteria bacterium]|nr:hypothetical protein [Deltaproteobacteria bacterium]